MKNTIVSTKWLKENLHNPDLIILDTSLKTTVGGQMSKYEDIIIPNARYFDIKQNFTDKSSAYPNTVPTASQFQQECQNLGINNSSQIVIYDNLGIYSSPRAWWLFRAMGHQNVAVLDGGLPLWIQDGYDTGSISQKQHSQGDFKASFDPKQIKYYDYIKDNRANSKSVVIDVRSKGRFDDTAPDPRKELQSGHIANSFNIPYKTLLKDGRFKSKEALSNLFEIVATDNRDLVFSCGSGMTACIALLACELVLPNPKSIYDGSWTEWAKKEGLMTT